MKSIGIINPLETKSHDVFQESSTIKIEKVPMKVGLLEQDDLEFPATDTTYDQFVLVEKIAFSCNYRDKTILLNLSAGLAKNATEVKDRLHFAFFGSEFVGKIIFKGKNVQGLEIGDRVIPDGTYQGRLAKGASKGIPSNTTSQFLEIYHENDLLKIPSEMSDQVAAGFTIGGQTAFGMIRNTGITKGTDVLITSATSNTSLFAICFLQQLGANVYAISSSKQYEERLRKMGVKEVFIINRNQLEEKKNQIEQLSKELLFDVVIDPFADTWMFHMASLMKNEGKYISCGYYNQSSILKNKLNNQTEPSLLRSFYGNMILKNLQFMGNCLGTRDDLKMALQQHHVVKDIIDSHFKAPQSDLFLERTFNAGDRFGKVIMEYT